ncbi:TPA: SgrR family transcriptional regulator [Klebsiella aerogenes]|nr:SgrR family transcriptional regulator [Klebsiella aerogenes]
MPFQKNPLMRRYHRLLTRYRTQMVDVSVQEVADTLVCTPRYARTLLRRMQDAGWVNWTPRAGRGFKGTLQCRVDLAALLAQQQGDYSPVPPEAFTPSAPSSSLSPAVTMGARYFISFYRPLLAIIPSVHTGRAERHVLHMVHDGLMRYRGNNPVPQPGLAHTVDVAANGLTWCFHLRQGLVWHNGEIVHPDQLVTALRRFAGTPGLPHVAQVTCRGHSLCLHLAQPDVMLAHRLASPVYALAHPDEPSCGLGPFRLSEHTADRLVLQRFTDWYGERPEVAEVVYETALQRRQVWSELHLETHRSRLIPQPVRTYESADTFSFLAFNQVRGSLTPAQQSVIRQIVRHATARLPDEVACRTASPPDGLPPGPESVADALLPPTLSLTYFHTPELYALLKLVEKSLRWRGCVLTITPLKTTHWLLPEEEWSRQDMVLGYLRLGMQPAFSPEERFRHSRLCRVFWGEDIWRRGLRQLDRSLMRDEARHLRQVTRLMRRVIRTHLLTPLYSQRYWLTVPENVRGVRICSQGLPDFTCLWTGDETDSG